MDATNVLWHIKFGTQLPLSSLPVVALTTPIGLGPPHRKNVPSKFPVIFFITKKKSQTKPKNFTKTPEQVNETFLFQSVPERAWEVATLQLNQKVLFYL